MTARGDYPAGAEYDSSAPWNERTKEPVSVEVEVTMLVKKRMMIETDDYEMDEEGCITEYGDLVQDVKDQLDVPNGLELIEIEEVDV